MKIFSLFILGLLITSQTVLAGKSVLNGGNSIQCSKSSKFDDGLNNLDFAILVSRGFRRENLVAVTSFEESINRIHKLVTSLPIKEDIKRAFTAYRESLFAVIRGVNLGKSEGFCHSSILPFKECWIPVRMESIEVGDKGDLFGMSSSCSKVLGTVARTETSEQSTFIYSPTNLKNIAKNPLQLSFLAIHEFLWNVTDDIEVNRKANWLLHSKATDKLSSEELLIVLKSLGVKIENFELNTPGTCVDFSGTYDIESSSGAAWLDQWRQVGCEYSDDTIFSKETGLEMFTVRSTFDGVLRPSQGIRGERIMQMWRDRSLVTITIFEIPEKMDIYWIKQDLLSNGDMREYRRYVSDSGFTSERTTINKKVRP